MNSTPSPSPPRSPSPRPVWPNAACRLLGLTVPVIQAPMGGGPSTVDLAVAVSDAGGLGSIAGGYLAPDQLREQIRAVRARTERPFAVNLFVLDDVAADDATIDAALAVLEPLRRRLGLAPRPGLGAWAQDVHDQLAVVLEERPPVFSFTFGPLPPATIEAFRAAGVLTVGTATNAAEAVELEATGVDVVCAQGAEAGGHHGTWRAPSEHSLIGTMALVPLVCDAVSVPVIAAGGVMDSRGVAAALCLGAGAAQMGTAFLLAPEAGTVPPHRRAVERAAETDVATTAEVTGRLARGVRNALMEGLRGHQVPPYPIMNALTTELRRTSAAHDDPELMSLWCGQAVPLAAATPAAELVRRIADDLEHRFGLGRPG